MLKSGDVLDLGPLDTVFHIKKTAAETNGRSLEMEWELGPHTGGTPVHIHPEAIETYEVLQGQLDVYVAGDWRTLRVGESISVDKAVPHTFRNASDETTRVYNTHQPAMQFDRYFARLHKLVNSGVVKSDKMTLKALLHLSILMTSYPGEIRSVQPPYAVMRVFASVGRLLGYQV
jgi:mannose-6-phosphate isomerase-like protein (cupin superfamily)